MNIQAEKNEIIRLITELSSEPVLKKIRSILNTAQKKDETARLMSNDSMKKKLDDSRQQIVEGKGVKIDLDEIWK